MKKIKMNDNDKFDLDLSQLDAQINEVDVFCERELTSIYAMNNFISTTHELKNQPSALNTDNFFIEYAMKVKGKFFYTGIVTSEAARQTYNVNDCIYSYPTEFIKWCYDNKERLELVDSKKNDTDYIGYGILIPICRINNLYQEFFKNKRIKTLFNKS